MLDGRQFGAWLGLKRQEAGLSRRQLSVRSGISTSQILNLEKGRVCGTREHTYRRLVDALRMDPETACAFCGDTQDTVDLLIPSCRRDDVFICDNCLSVCVAYIALRNRSSIKVGRTPRARARPIRKGRRHALARLCGCHRHSRAVRAPSADCERGR